MNVQNIKAKLDKLERSAQLNRNPLVIIIKNYAGRPPGIVILGSVTPEQEKALREKALAEWKAKQKQNRLPISKIDR